jgi:predicted Zn-dependent protease
VVRYTAFAYLAAKTIEAQVDTAIASWQAGDADRAIAILEPLAVQWPDEQSIRGLLGSYYHDSGRSAEARSHLEAAVVLEPKA